MTPITDYAPCSSWKVLWRRLQRSAGAAHLRWGWLHKNLHPVGGPDGATTCWGLRRGAAEGWAVATAAYPAGACPAPFAEEGPLVKGRCSPFKPRDCQTAISTPASLPCGTASHATLVKVGGRILLGGGRHWASHQVRPRHKWVCNQPTPTGSRIQEMCLSLWDFCRRMLRS